MDKIPSGESRNASGGDQFRSSRSNHPEFQSRLDAVMNDPTVPDSAKQFIKINIARQQERLGHLVTKQRAHVKSIQSLQNAAEYWKLRFELCSQALKNFMNPVELPDAVKQIS